MSPTFLRSFVFTCLAFGCASLAHADIIVTPTFDVSNQTQAPDTTDYEGVFYDGSSTFPPASQTLGSFNFTVPTGDYITGGTISGTFGDTNIPVSTLADLYVLNGTIQVGACDDFSDDCATGNNGLVTWSYTFNSSDLANLNSDFNAGTLDFTAVQNSPFGAIVVGSPTLDLQVAQTPEPASMLLLASGLAGLAAWRRRK